MLEIVALRVDAGKISLVGYASARQCLDVVRLPLLALEDRLVADEADLIALRYFVDY